MPDMTKAQKQGQAIAVSGDQTQTRMTVKIGDVVLGDGVPKICVPVAAESGEQLEETLKKLEKMRPLYDLVEFRADIYPLKSADEIPQILCRIREASGKKPVLFTFRTKAEGGKREITFEDYRAMNLRAAEWGTDLVDLQLELVSREDPDASLLKQLQGTGTRVIGSFHDFHGTPSADELVRKMVRMQMMGFDISKIAVMPRDREDVLELLFASVQMQEDWADRPYITMSMGETGKVSRISGSFTGSAVTFASLDRASAPGQVRADAMRQILEELG